MAGTTSKQRATAAATETPAKTKKAATRATTTATVDPTAGPVPMMLGDMGEERKSRTGTVKAGPKGYAPEAKEELLERSGPLPQTVARAQRAKLLNAQYVAAEQQRRVASAVAPETYEDEAITTGDDDEFDEAIEQALRVRQRAQQVETYRANRSARQPRNTNTEIWLAEDPRNPINQRRAARAARIRWWIVRASWFALSMLLIIVAALIYAGMHAAEAVSDYQARHVIHANFGRGDETITAYVQDHKVLIVEVPAADPSKSHVYATADLRESGYQDAAHVADQDVTLEVMDINGDGKPDVLINVQITPGNLIAQPTVMRWTLINDGKELKFAGSSTTSVVGGGK